MARDRSCIINSQVHVQKRNRQLKNDSLLGTSRLNDLPAKIKDGKKASYLTGLFFSRGQTENEYRAFTLIRYWGGKSRNRKKEKKVTLTIACSILLSIATVDTPALKEKRNYEMRTLCIEVLSNWAGNKASEANKHITLTIQSYINKHESRLTGSL